MANSILMLHVGVIGAEIDRIVSRAWGNTLADDEDKELKDKYEYLLNLHRLYIQAVDEGLNDFTFKMAHEKGWLSRHTYRLFRNNLLREGVLESEMHL